MIFVSWICDRHFPSAFRTYKQNKPIPKTKRLSTLNHYHEEQLNTVVLILHSIREVPSFFN